MDIKGGACGMNKKFAPTLITIIAVILCLAFSGSIAVAMIMTRLNILMLFGIIFSLGVLGVIVALIINLVRRYREINKEDEEDDLSQY